MMILFFMSLGKTEKIPSTKIFDRYTKLSQNCRTKRTVSKFKKIGLLKMFIKLINSNLIRYLKIILNFFYIIQVHLYFSLTTKIVQEEVLAASAN